jgi:hypothetical protein
MPADQFDKTQFNNWKATKRRGRSPVRPSQDRKICGDSHTGHNKEFFGAPPSGTFCMLDCERTRRENVRTPFNCNLPKGGSLALSNMSASTSVEGERQVPIQSVGTTGTCLGGI